MKTLDISKCSLRLMKKFQNKENTDDSQVKNKSKFFMDKENSIYETHS